MHKALVGRGGVGILARKPARPEAGAWTREPKLVILRALNAPVAQRIRVLASEAKGRGFESRRARHSCTKLGATPALPAIAPRCPELCSRCRRSAGRV